MSRIHVLALGGTIAMTAGDGGGVVPALDADALVGALGPAVEGVELRAETVRVLPGAHLEIGHVLDVVARARAALEGGAAGVVVVQGTDTLEETAFAADVLYDRPEPLVFTGAMRHPAALGADGSANLADSLVAAASPAARGCGVLVCLGGELHAARFVRKVHAFSPGAFASPSLGPLGWVAEGRVTLPLRPSAPPRLTLGAAFGGAIPRVLLYRVSLGDDGRFLAAAAAAEGCDGVVLEAFGVGHAHPGLAAAAARLAADVPVVLASRTGAGAALEETYGFEGSERDFLARGLISAGALDGLKARLLLALALAAGAPRADLPGLYRAWSA